jgi:hypothetical protein
MQHGGGPPGGNTGALMKAAAIAITANSSRFKQGCVLPESSVGVDSAYEHGGRPPGSNTGALHNTRLHNTIQYSSTGLNLHQALVQRAIFCSHLAIVAVRCACTLVGSDGGASASL